MLGIDAAFLVLELGTGIWVGSLALMADAFHMVSRPLVSWFPVADGRWKLCVGLGAG